MKHNWHFLLAGIIICFCLAIVVPVHAADKHVSDCLDGEGDCLEELENPDQGLTPAEENPDNQHLSSGGSSNLFFTITKMVAALLLVLALIYFLLFMIKRKNKLFQQAGVIENMGGVSVGQQKSVQMIRIGDTMYVIGVGENVELLSEIKDKTIIQQLLEQQAAKEEAPSMLEVFLPKRKKEQQKQSFTSALQQELTKLQERRQQMSNTAKDEEDRNE